MESLEAMVDGPGEEEGQEREAEECHRHDSMEDEQWAQGAEEAFDSEKVDAPK